MSSVTLDDFEIATHLIIQAGRLKSTAARRQVLSDTIRCCVVNAYDISGPDDAAVADVAYDLDSVRGPIAVLCRKRSLADMHVDDDAECLVPTRLEPPYTEPGDPVIVPETVHVDLGLSHYTDAYNSEDLQYDLLTSTNSTLVRTVPWFDEFEETLHVSNSKPLDRVSRSVRYSFRDLKKHYLRLSALHSSLYTHYWIPLVAEPRLHILQRNFPKGVLGLRALHNPDDARAVRALVMKHEDEVRRSGRHAHILNRRMMDGDGGGANTPELAEVSTDPPESKHAVLPDLKQVWSVSTRIPRIGFIDTNRRLCGEAMRDLEREAGHAVAVWTLFEVRIFLERLGTYGKNFRKISLSLQEKSEKDCAEFYYRFKIALNMKAIITAAIPRAGGRSTPENLGGHKSLVDSILDSLGGEFELFNQITLEKLNSRLATRVMNQSVKTWKDFENPLQEKKNAIIDLLANAIARGHPYPPQLEPPVAPPVIIAPAPRRLLTVESIAIVKPTFSFSVVKTETAVLAPLGGLVSPPEVPPSRSLQTHNTI